MDNIAGQVVKGYQLRERIGAGGFGAVYKAFQTTIGREVAIKVVLPQFANQPEFIRRFENEAQLVARLEHPFIVPLFDYWREPDRAYLVMRYYPRSLHQALLETGVLNLEETAKILDQIAGALTVAHRNHVIHRDIKPENIMQDDDHNAYLTDFGIASHLSGTREDEKAASFTGSPAYVSPEVISQGESTPQSDIYSLGYVVYRLLTGQSPINDESMSRWLLHHLSEPLPMIDNVPPAVNLVLQQATSKDPSARYSSALEMATAFRRAISQQGSLSDTGQMDLFYNVLTNPYKGLRAFEESDAADFFGRSVLIDQLINRMAERHPYHHFLAVVGPSGSGKSSVVKAGVIPALRRGALPGSEKWFYAEMTPGTQPLEKLATALLSVAVQAPADLEHTLRRDKYGLLKAVNQLVPEGEHLVLAIDQFEEIFTLTEDENERQHFLESLRIAVTDETTRLYVIVTLRADFYDKPLMYDKLADLMRHRTEVVIPLTPEELERAIIGPAERVGLQVDSNLIAAVIAELQDEPGILPLLQYALTEVFEKREGRNLTLSAYQSSGGALGALARRAEEIYTGMSSERQALIRQIFLRLVTLGEGTEDTRRRVLLSELNSTVADKKALDTILDTYGKYRLFTFDHDPQTREPSIEIAHEALIRRWSRLREWLDESRGDVRLQRLLAVAASEWRQHRQDKGFLLRDARLAQFEEWHKATDVGLTSEEREFLDTSIAEQQAQEKAENARRGREMELQQRVRQRLQAIVAILLIASAIGIILTLLIFNQSRNAQQERDRAQVARDEAVIARSTSDANLQLAERSLSEVQSLALAANAQRALVQNNPDLAVVLAMNANMISTPPEQAQQILLEVASLSGTHRVFGNHTNNVWTVAISPDGQVSAAGAGGFSPGTNFYNNLPTYLPINTAPMPTDNLIRLSDLTTGEELRQLEGHTNTVSDIVFSPDGSTLYSASGDGTIRKWNLATGEGEILAEGLNVVMSLAITPDGTHLLSSDYSFDADRSNLILWDTGSGAEIRRFEGQNDVIFSVDISHDGTLAISTSGPNGPFSPSSGDNDIVLWNLATGEEIRRFKGHVDAVFKAEFLPDDARIISSSGDSSIKLWDVETGAELATFQGHTAFAYAFEISPDGHTLFSAGFDNQLIFWDIDRQKELRRFYGVQGLVSDLAFLPSGTQLVTSSENGTLRLWDLYGPNYLERWTAPGGRGYWSMDISTDGRWLLVASSAPGIFAPYMDARQIHLFDLTTGEEIRQFDGHVDNIFDLNFLPDGNQFVSVSGNPFVPGGDNVMILWDVNTGEEIRRFEPGAGGVTGVALVPVQNQAITLSFGTILTLWDLETGEQLRVYEGAVPVWRAVAISPNGQYVVAGGADGLISIWDFETAELLAQLPGHTSLINEIDFINDGSGFVSGSDDGVAIVWDMDTRTAVLRFTEQGNPVNSVAISPDGQFVLTGGLNGTILLWDAGSGKVLSRFQEHQDGIYELKFTGDVAKLFSTSFDGTLIQWDAATMDLEALKTWVQTNRYLRELSCEERTVYRIEPLCQESSS